MKERILLYPFSKRNIFYKPVMVLLFAMIFHHILLAGDPPPPPDHISTENVPGGGAILHGGLALFMILSAGYLFIKCKCLKIWLKSNFKYLRFNFNLNQMPETDQ